MDKLDIFDGMEGSELIQETFLFKKLSFDETAKLSAQFEKKEYEDKDEILHEHSIGGALYIIETGNVAIVKSIDGQDEALINLGPGELFGEMSLIEDALTSASVIARGKVVCFVLPKAALDKMMTADPVFSSKIYEAFCHVLSERLRNTTDQLLKHGHKPRGN